MVPDCPLSAADGQYLEGLLQAGSQAAYAEASGVSRAAVTQRLQRIRARIAKLEPATRGDAREWLEDVARQAASQRH